MITSTVKMYSTDFICRCVCLIQEVSEVIEQQRHLMKCVLDDTRLNRLRLEGGTVLARIRKEEACENENYRYCRKYEWTLNHMRIVNMSNTYGDNNINLT